MSRQICDVCGFENESGAVICAECGNVLNRAEETPQFQQAPVQQNTNQQYGYQQQYANPQYQQYPNQQYGYQQQYANPQYRQNPGQQYGYQQQYANPQYQQYPNQQYGYQQQYQRAYAPDDAPSTGIAVASFFIPLLGLILYLTWNSTYPQKAKSAGKGALVGFIVNTIVSIVATGIIYGLALM